MMMRILVSIAVLSALLHTSHGACNGTCAPGWFFDQATGKCYKVFNTQKPWIEARAICRSGGGDLLEIQSEDDLPTIIRYPDIFPQNTHYWIGLNDRTVEGTFRWNNRQENVTYFKWARNQPMGNQNDCGTVFKGREMVEWYNMKCSTKYKFLCQSLTNEDKEVYNFEHRAELNVTCPSDWERVPGKRMCVKLFNTNVQYNEAMNKCRDEIPGHTNLVNIPDMEVNDFFYGRLGRHNYWIAPTDQVEEGTYMNTTLPGAKQVTYLPWKSGGGRGVNNDCVMLFPGPTGVENMFSDVSCTSSRHYICQYDPPPPLPTEKICPEGWLKFSPSESCFKAMDEKRKMWEAAREDCEEMDGDLATIPDQETQDFLKDMVSDGRYWIGLVDEARNGTFTWLGQDTEIEFEAWINRHHNDGGCVEMIANKDGLWNDKVCTVKRHFICEKPAVLPTLE